MRIPLGSFTARARRLGAGLLVLALLALTTGTAGADTQSKLNSAEQKLSQARRHDPHRAAEGQRRQVNLVKIQAKVDCRPVRLRRRRRPADRSPRLALDHAGRLRGRRRATSTTSPRQAYMNGPGASLEMLLGATSMGDLNDRAGVHVQRLAGDVDARRRGADRRLASWGTAGRASITCWRGRPTCCAGSTPRGARSR